MKMRVAEWLMDLAGHIMVLAGKICISAGRADYARNIVNVLDYGAKHERMSEDWTAPQSTTPRGRPELLSVEEDIRSPQKIGAFGTPAPRLTRPRAAEGSAETEA